MSTGLVRRVSLATRLMLPVAAWILFVPGQVSIENWAGLNAAAVALAVTLVCLDRLQPAGTTAQVRIEATDRTGL